MLTRLVKKDVYQGAKMVKEAILYHDEVKLIVRIRLENYEALALMKSLCREGDRDIYNRYEGRDKDTEKDMRWVGYTHCIYNPDWRAFTEQGNYKDKEEFMEKVVCLLDEMERELKAKIRSVDNFICYFQVSLEARGYRIE